MADVFASGVLVRPRTHGRLRVAVIKKMLGLRAIVLAPEHEVDVLWLRAWFQIKKTLVLL